MTMDQSTRTTISGTRRNNGRYCCCSCGHDLLRKEDSDNQQQSSPSNNDNKKRWWTVFHSLSLAFFALNVAAGVTGLVLSNQLENFHHAVAFGLITCTYCVVVIWAASTRFYAFAIAAAAVPIQSLEEEEGSTTAAETGGGGDEGCSWRTARRRRWWWSFVKTVFYTSLRDPLMYASLVAIIFPTMAIVTAVDYFDIVEKLWLAPIVFGGVSLLTLWTMRLFLVQRYSKRELDRIVKDRVRELLTAVLAVIVFSQIAATTKLAQHDSDDLANVAVHDIYRNIEDLNWAFLWNDSLPEYDWKTIYPGYVQHFADPERLQIVRFVNAIVEANQDNKEVQEDLDRYIESVATAVSAISLFLAVSLIRDIQCEDGKDEREEDEHGRDETEPAAPAWRLSVGKWIVMVLQAIAVGTLFALIHIDKEYVDAVGFTVLVLQGVSLFAAWVETVWQLTRLKPWETAWGHRPQQEQDIGAGAVQNGSESQPPPEDDGNDHHHEDRSNDDTNKQSDCTSREDDKDETTFLDEEPYSGVVAAMTSTAAAANQPELLPYEDDPTEQATS